jgi:hypothetical protein
MPARNDGHVVFMISQRDTPVTALAAVRDSERCGGHQFAVRDPEAEASQLLERSIARMRRRISDKAQLESATAKALDSLHSTDGRLVLDVQHAVEIDQKRSEVLEHGSNIADDIRPAATANG